jgi:hypothetical protein
MNTPTLDSVSLQDACADALVAWSTINRMRDFKKHVGNTWGLMWWRWGAAAGGGGGGGGGGCGSWHSVKPTRSRVASDWWARTVGGLLHSRATVWVNLTDCRADTQQMYRQVNQSPEDCWNKRWISSRRLFWRPFRLPAAVASSVRRKGSWGVRHWRDSPRHIGGPCFLTTGTARVELEGAGHCLHQLCATQLSPFKLRRITASLWWRLQLLWMPAASRSVHSNLWTLNLLTCCTMPLGPAVTPHRAPPQRLRTSRITIRIERLQHVQLASRIQVNPLRTGEGVAGDTG